MSIGETVNVCRGRYARAMRTGARGSESTAPGRHTRQRTAVHEALCESDRFVSAQTLHHQMRRRGHQVGLATVYRQLHHLASAGDVDTVSTSEGSLYRICASRTHHHHLICRACGRTAEIEASPVEQWTREVSEAHSFTDVDHNVEMFGTCRECVS